MVNIYVINNKTYKIYYKYSTILAVVYFYD
jgi:hypothetical protein